MKKFSYQHFRLCVFAFDAAHVFASYFFGVGICHWAKVKGFLLLFNQIENFLFCCFTVIESIYVST